MARFKKIDDAKVPKRLFSSAPPPWITWGSFVKVLIVKAHYNSRIKERVSSLVIATKGTQSLTSATVGPNIRNLVHGGPKHSSQVDHTTA